jgi:hypothetical protein
VEFREERALGVEGLVLERVVRDDGVDDDRFAVGGAADGVGAEDHRGLLGAQPDAGERPEVVVVERRGDHLDTGPVLGNRRRFDLTHREGRERVVGVHCAGVSGEHRG